MTLDYEIYIASGTGTAYNYTNQGNLSHLEITNSDDTYYQTGFFTSFANQEHTVGDTTLIYINSVRQFNGYISRKQQTIKGGKKTINYQLIGKTYDLWRYYTGEDITYLGNTGYIASSLVSTYCNGITVNVDNTKGYNITNAIDLSDTLIGDCIVRLTELDGYRFYVDYNNVLQYYYPSTNKPQTFQVQESDIIEMEPVEESDEDLVNDVLVIGGTDYSYKTIVDTPNPSSISFPSGILVAQSFTAEDDLVSAVQLYLDRSTDPNQPGTLYFEVWKSTNKELLNTDFDDDADLTHNYGMQTYESFLELDGTTHNHWNTQYGTYSKEGVYLGQTWTATADGILQKVWCRSNGTDSPAWHYVTEVDGSNHPDLNNIIASGYHALQNGGNWIDMHKSMAKINNGTMYAIVWQNARLYSGYLTYTNGAAYRSTDGSTWTAQSPNPSDWAFDVKTIVYDTTGQTVTTTWTDACQYMKLDYDVDNSGTKIYISGTNDGGTTWESLNDNEWVDFGTESTTGVQIKFKMSSNGDYTPRLDSAVLTIGDATGSGSGNPKSGSKLEFSDEVSFSAGDVVYPPSFSAWQTYTSPKLKVEEDLTYWMVMCYTSGANDYWNIYNYPKSTYNGRIMYSWDNGVNWSSNSSDPTQVPSGNLLFKLGMRSENIRATATNQQSINNFGRYFKKIQDSKILTEEQALQRANYEISGMESLKKKGTLTIEGREDMSPEYRFSANLSNFAINELWDVRSYTQKIDNKGFTTLINYGIHSFDIASEVAKNTKNRESGD